MNWNILRKFSTSKILLSLIFLLTLSGLTLSYLAFAQSNKDPVLEIVPEISEKTTKPTFASADIDSIRTYIKSHDGLTSWKYLISLKDSPSGIRLHDFAHLIGSKMYIDLSLSAITKCDTSYAFGCYHGVVEEFIATKGVDTLTEVVDYCKKDQPQIALTCYHGMGHGLLTYYKYKLVPALEKCDDLLSERDAPFCHRGVFMEFGSEFQNKISRNDPLWPCTTVDTIYKLTCYGYQMTYLSTLYAGDTQAIEKACLKAETLDYRNECLRGLGHLIGQQMIKSPEKAVKVCQKMNAASSDTCIIAAAQEMVFQGESNTEINEILCKALSGTAKNDCEEKTAVQQRIQISPNSQRAL